MDNKRLDEAVEAAGFAFCGTTSESMLTAAGDEVFRDAMRAALLAGMKVLLGEPVAWRVWILSEPELGTWLSEERGQDDSNVVYEPLYAPSLGEGE